MHGLVCPWGGLRSLHKVINAWVVKSTLGVAGSHTPKCHCGGKPFRVAGEPSVHYSSNTRVRGRAKKVRPEERNLSEGRIARVLMQLELCGIGEGAFQPIT